MAVGGGLLLGLLNGLVVVRYRILPLIGTLADLFHLCRHRDGVDQRRLDFRRAELVDALRPRRLCRHTRCIFSVSCCRCSLVTAAMLTFTSWGRWIYALGFNERSARLVGIPVDRVRLLVYTLLGRSRGLAALVSIAWFGSARPNIGVNLELESLAAALLGGVAISGGVGGVLGVLLAVVMIVTLKTGLQFINTPTIYQVGIVGLLLILSLLFDLLPRIGDRDDQP